MTEQQRSNVAQLRSIDGQGQAADKAPAVDLPIFILQAEYDGFPVTVQFHGKAEKLRATVEALKQQGATPPTRAASANSQPATKTAGDGKPPKCPVHRIPMKESRKKGTFFCPKKDEDSGEYCDEKA